MSYNLIGDTTPDDDQDADATPVAQELEEVGQFTTTIPTPATTGIQNVPYIDPTILDLPDQALINYSESSYSLTPTPQIVRYKLSEDTKKLMSVFMKGHGSRFQQESIDNIMAGLNTDALQLSNQEFALWNAQTKTLLQNYQDMQNVTNKDLLKSILARCVINEERKAVLLAAIDARVINILNIQANQISVFLILYPLALILANKTGSPQDGAPYNFEMHVTQLRMDLVNDIFAQCLFFGGQANMFRVLAKQNLIFRILNCQLQAHGAFVELIKFAVEARTPAMHFLSLCIFLHRAIFTAEVFNKEGSDAEQVLYLLGNLFEVNGMESHIERKYEQLRYNGFMQTNTIISLSWIPSINLFRDNTRNIAVLKLLITKYHVELLHRAFLGIESNSARYERFKAMISDILNISAGEYTGRDLIHGAATRLAAYRDTRRKILFDEHYHELAEHLDNFWHDYMVRYRSAELKEIVQHSPKQAEIILTSNPPTEYMLGDRYNTKWLRLLWAGWQTFLGYIFANIYSKYAWDLQKLTFLHGSNSAVLQQIHLTDNSLVPFPELKRNNILPFSGLLDRATVESCSWESFGITGATFHNPYWAHYYAISAKVLRDKEFLREFATQTIKRVSPFDDVSNLSETVFVAATIRIRRLHLTTPAALEPPLLANLNNAAVYVLELLDKQLLAGKIKDKYDQARYDETILKIEDYLRALYAPPPSKTAQLKNLAAPYPMIFASTNALPAPPYFGESTLICPSMMKLGKEVDVIFVPWYRIWQTERKIAELCKNTAKPMVYSFGRLQEAFNLNRTLCTNSAFCAFKPGVF